MRFYSQHESEMFHGTAEELSSVFKAERISGAAEDMENRIKSSSPVALTKPERMLLYKYKGTLLPQSDPN